VGPPTPRSVLELEDPLVSAGGGPEHVEMIWRGAPGPRSSSLRWTKIRTRPPEVTNDVCRRAPLPRAPGRHVSPRIFATSGRGGETRGLTIIRIFVSSGGPPF